MKRIASILKVSEQGVSKPFVCKDEDGGVRWCKGSHTGFRSLVSEWVCARLAREAGLPVPDFGIFRLDYRDFRAWRGVQNYAVPDLVTEANQFVFGSLNVENSKDVFDFELDLGHIDRQMLSRIYWFDELIRNTDRTYFNSNLLVNGSVYIIDHNNAFDYEFEKCAFEGEHILRDCRYAISTDEIQAFRARMREIALGPFLEGVWSEMPDTWAEVGDSVLPLCDVRRVIMEGCDG
ncbi:MAG: HipA domain-containing protein [Kiritimatiellae bacterium]|nr:HipA domain-containing protein [Kiritimatiellia bacterium]